MTKCIVRGCKTRQIKKQRAGEISLHCFPKSPKRIRQWLESTGQYFDDMEAIIRKIMETKAGVNYRMCSVHFTPDCFQMIGSRRSLKNTAVPSIFPPVDNSWPIDEAAPSTSGSAMTPLTIKSTTLPMHQVISRNNDGSKIWSSPYTAAEHTYDVNLIERYIDEKGLTTTIERPVKSISARSIVPIDHIRDFESVSTTPSSTQSAHMQKCTKADKPPVKIISARSILPIDTSLLKKQDRPDLGSIVSTDSAATSSQKIVDPFAKQVKFRPILPKPTSQPQNQEHLSVPSLNVIGHSSPLKALDEQNINLTSTKSTFITCKTVGTWTGSYDDFMAEVAAYEKMFAEEDANKEKSTSGGNNKSKTTTTSRILSCISDWNDDVEDINSPSEQEQTLLPLMDTSMLSGAPSALDESMQNVTTDVADTSYISENESLSADETVKQHEASAKFVKERKFIVFESCLDELLKKLSCKHVKRCDAAVEHIVKSIVGTCLIVFGECTNGHKSKLWQSQPLIGETPVGNVLICSAVLLTGNYLTKIKDFFDILFVPFVSTKTFSLYENNYLFRAIDQRWKKERDRLLKRFCGKAIGLLGDGQCDTTGFSSKYCTYTLMEESSEKIIDLNIIHVSETTSSLALKAKAFRRSINNVLNEGLKIMAIATDRQVAIRKIMQEEYREINHQFDLWNYTKTIHKKLTLIARKTENHQLMPWIPSIINHLWYSAAYCEGNIILLTELWKSVVNHVANNHSWDNGIKIHKCLHSDISQDETKKRPWLRKNSQAYSELLMFVCDKEIIQDLFYLKNFCHSENMELFRSLVRKFRPKHVQFKIDAVIARTQLAVLAHNASIDRFQGKVKHASRVNVDLEQECSKHLLSKMKTVGQFNPIYEETTNQDMLPIMEDVIKMVLAE
ncbi:uncharacterized protein LOC128644937 [Bombina bombina]|uniref:uncharacterized protein LOC128644937 n=1 Tax=Bombina bombina TaxID=8345 RepID=UPI00235AA8EA|nr:uncharacterized protein LOC128644937 [Bombina bombina]XP_053553583.1 uncharacterized protein LOC128644937 [Bombina bombina]XP_053553584.1 uncharacterized protein LOC128644937 [Bombina bombina]